MKKLSFWAVPVVWMLTAVPLAATQGLQLQFPAPAEETAQRTEAMASSQIAFGPFANGEIVTKKAVGSLQQVAWRLDLPRASTLQLLDSLRQQIIAAGFSPRFECETDECGGFDFRYGTDILPEPDMHIDLGDFRYLAAERQGASGPEYIAILVSRSPQKGFVQLTQIADGPAEWDATKSDLQLAAATKAPEMAMAPGQTLEQAPSQQQVLQLGSAISGSLATKLDHGSALVLEDLVFLSGSSSLSEGSYTSLGQLAAWLQANPGRNVTLVGHTDASGGFAGNVALSKKRAESVRQFMLRNFSIPATAISADGVGPLAPRASNMDEVGRAQNRRVEVLPTSTQ